MSAEVRYQVYYKENEFGCCVPGNEAHDNYESAKIEFEERKLNHEVVFIEKETSERLDYYEEPFPYQFGDKVKIIKQGKLNGIEGKVWQYNKRNNNIIIDIDGMTINFELNDIQKIL